jgi:hypothetical protein
MNHLASRKWQFLGIFCLGCCVLILLRQNFHLQAEEVQQFKEQRTPHECKKIDVLKVVKLEWNNPLSLKLTQVHYRPSKGFNAVDYSQVPGPKSYPVRSNLIPYINLEGIVGGVEDGTGRKEPKLVLLGDVPKAISLPTEPYGLGARSDGGAWVLFGKNLVHYNAEGILKLSVRNPGGTKILVTKENNVWILDLSHAWFVNSKGHVRGSWQWNGFLDSVVMGKALCTLERALERRIKCLEPNGKEKFINLGWLKQKPSGFLLGVTDDALLTGERYVLNKYRKNGGVERLVLENAGLTVRGDAFISVQADASWADVCISNGEARSVSVQYVNPSFRFPPPKMTVAAIQNERTLTYGYDRAIWYKNGQLERRLTINDWRYENEIFPHLWNTNGLHLMAEDSGETVVLSSSGSTGIALIKLRWNP